MRDEKADFFKEKSCCAGNYLLIGLRLNREITSSAIALLLLCGAA